MVVTIPHSTIIDEIKDVISLSRSLNQLIQKFQSDHATMPQHILKDGLLFWRHRLLIPVEARSVILQILHEFHSSAIGGHARFLCTRTRVATYFYWSGMRRDISAFIRQCQVCQQAKSLQTFPAGLLSPLPIPNQVWEDVIMDFITGFPLSRGYFVIFVIIDRLLSLLILHLCGPILLHSKLLKLSSILWLNCMVFLLP